MTIDHRADDPSSLFVTSYERMWPAHADLFNFVGRRDRNAALKSLEWEIYWQAIEPYLSTLPSGAHVLDVGCGVGRFLIPLAQRNYTMTGVDMSRLALDALRANLAAANVGAELCHTDVRDLSAFADGTFAAALSIELLCYLTAPEVALREIARVVAADGIVALSVEGLLGSVAADPKLTGSQVQAALQRGEILSPGEFFVRYYDASSLRALVEAADLECLAVIGTHYVPDGPFGRLLGDLDLWDDQVRRAVLAWERGFADHPMTQSLARAWLALCRKR